MLGKKRMQEENCEEEVEILIESELIYCISDDECAKTDNHVNNSIKRKADFNHKMTNEDIFKNIMTEDMWIKKDPIQIRKTTENKIFEKISANKIYSNEMSCTQDRKDNIKDKISYNPFIKDSNKKEEKIEKDVHTKILQTENKSQNVFRKDTQPKMYDEKLNLSTSNNEAFGLKKKTAINLDNKQKIPSTVSPFKNKQKLPLTYSPLNKKQKLNGFINENKIEKKYFLQKNYSLVLNINTPVTQDEFLEKLISSLKRDDKIHGVFEGENVYTIFRVDHLNKLGWGLCLKECELIEKVKSNFSIFFREEKSIVLHKNENNSLEKNKIISRETKDLLSDEIKIESSIDQKNDQSVSDLKLKLYELDVIKNRNFFVKSGAISSKMFL